jgi:hypothetical protein
MVVVWCFVVCVVRVCCLCVVVLALARDVHLLLSLYDMAVLLPLFSNKKWSHKKCSCPGNTTTDPRVNDFKILKKCK